MGSTWSSVVAPPISWPASSPRSSPRRSCWSWSTTARCTASIVRSYATAAEEDNDGGGPRYIVAQVLPGAGADVIPDVVVLTEGTGDAIKGALGIYRGQRGRMQIEVTVAGRSCHGSMPFEGLNPLEHGGAIIAEAARRHAMGDGFRRAFVPRPRHTDGFVVDARHPQ